MRAIKWPNLAKMVKQYFPVPASSAGVERVFSAAGKMHGDLQKSAKVVGDTSEYTDDTSSRASLHCLRAATH